ncbi:MAG: zinc-binding dehydrogenase [Bryobacterales bacterium]|nr:zinc-binding dehydrogenase [Bryobacterales bacterium]
MSGTAKGENDKMKAVKYLGNKQVRVIEIERPCPAVGHALVRVVASGICRTDVELLYDQPQPLEVIGGHEIAGVIEEANGLNRFQAGDRVLVNCHVTCGKCKHCANGDLIFCPQLRVFGFDVNGGNEEYLSAPESCLRSLPDDLSFEVGVLLNDALATPYHAVKKAVRAGDRIGIIGMGPVGLMAVICAKHFGATVAAFDRLARRLDQARSFGADVAVNTAEDDAKNVARELSGGDGLDAIVECSGASGAINVGCDLLKVRGVLALVGVCLDLRINPTEKILFKELSVVGSRNCNSNELEELIELARKAPSLSDVITHRFPIEEAAEAYRLAEQRKGIKILLTP